MTKIWTALAVTVIADIVKNVKRLSSKMKCKTCFNKLDCDEQTECKNNNYFLYRPEYWVKLTEFIEAYNRHAHMRHPEIDSDFFDACELKMAKAFLDGYPEIAVRVSKIILALKDIGDIKIKID